MADQTESTARSPRGPALAILATAPRPGLVLQGTCPPLTPAEAAALQTAWLKGIAQELPGVTVVLFGEPADALPMLRYFAGPGVELRERIPRRDGQGPVEPRTAAAAELFALGHGPVLVRSADAPEPGRAELLACAMAAGAGELVIAPDQHGGAWLVGFATPAQAMAWHRAGGRSTALAAALAAQGGPTTIRRGPWARRVTSAADLQHWLDERRPAAVAPWLAVRDLQAALHWYEQVLGAELEDRGRSTATVRWASTILRLHALGADATANGVWLPCPEPRALAAAVASRSGLEDGDHCAERAGGGSDFTATDPDGNRLTFGTLPGVR